MTARTVVYMDPGTLLSTTHDAGDGLCVRLRLARPSDALRLRRLVGGDMVRHFTFYNPRERLSVVAVAMVGRREEILGVADPDHLIVEGEHPGVTDLLASAVDSLIRRRAA